MKLSKGKIYKSLRNNHKQSMKRKKNRGPKGTHSSRRRIPKPLNLHKTTLKRLKLQRGGEGEQAQVEATTETGETPQDNEIVPKIVVEDDLETEKEAESSDLSPLPATDAEATDEPETTDAETTDVPETTDAEATEVDATDAEATEVDAPAVPEATIAEATEDDVHATAIKDVDDTTSETAVGTREEGDGSAEIKSSDEDVPAAQDGNTAKEGEEGEESREEEETETPDVTKEELEEKLENMTPEEASQPVEAETEAEKEERAEFEEAKQDTEHHAKTAVGATTGISPDTTISELVDILTDQIAEKLSSKSKSVGTDNQDGNDAVRSLAVSMQTGGEGGRKKTRRMRRVRKVNLTRKSA